MHFLTILSRLGKPKSSKAFSSTGYLATLAATGLLSTAMLPMIKEFVAQADYNTLAHAKQVLSKSIEINYQIHKIRGGDQLEIRGEIVPLRFGYPYATQVSLNAYASLDGFSMDKQVNRMRIWSPAKSYCMIYFEAAITTNTINHAYISDIQAADQGACV